MRTAIIIVAGSDKQNKCFWPTYNSIETGTDHDLIVVHRNRQFVPNVSNKNGVVIYENKIGLNGELPHKAFGAYRHYFNKYKNDYDSFAFISDDVLIKRRDWLKEAVGMLFSYDKLGFLGTQIFNGNLKQYPHPSHCRAPIWFGKSDALERINWQFNSDHEGEMRIADQFLAVGYFGAQIGNKVDFAYDSIERGRFFVGDHVAPLMAKKLGLDIAKEVSDADRCRVNSDLKSRLDRKDDSLFIDSPFEHIGRRKVISQMQPFNGLIYDKSVNLCNDDVEDVGFGIKILKKFV